MCYCYAFKHGMHTFSSEICECSQNSQLFVGALFDPKIQKRPRTGVLGGALKQAWYWILANGLACNSADVRARNAQIGKFAIAHQVQFVNGLTIFAPVGECAGQVHGMPRFSVFAGTSASPHLMS